MFGLLACALLELLGDDLPHAEAADFAYSDLIPPR
jgi:hypothetical protein